MTEICLGIITAQEKKEENKYLKEEMSLWETIRMQKTVKFEGNMLIQFFMNSHT